MNYRRFWKYRIITLVLSGLLLIGAGLFLLTTPTPVQSQTAGTAEPSPQAEADYVGATECRSCHRSVASDHADTRHALTLQEAKPKNIAADFTQGEDVRQVQFPGEDAPRAFTADDIAYVVGSGRNVQRYLYKVGRNEYLVFPAEWNVTEQKWEPLRRGAKAGTIRLRLESKLRGLPHHRLERGSRALERRRRPV